VERCHLACTGELGPLNPTMGGGVGLGQFLTCHTTLAPRKGWGMGEGGELEITAHHECWLAQI
jgi:hypothetical protein